MANQIYDAGLDALLNGDVDWLTDDIKVVLVDAADYTVDVSSDAHLDDIPAPARISTSGNLASKTVLMGALGAADTSFSSVSGDEFEAAVVYADTGVESTSTLLAYIDTGVGFPFTPDGGTVTLAWDSGTVIDFGLTQRIILAFDTEADRLAAVPQDGTLGWQTDTASLYVYVDGATPGWQPVGGSSVVVDGHISDATDAHDASAISFDPTGLAVISGTDVQTALEGLDAAGGGGGGGGAGTINQATYVYTGASETWTVPAGVTAVSVTCLGGPGGADTVGNDTAFMGNACVTGIVEVTPSTDVTIYVGGAGEDGNGSGTSAGGFPDGGDGAKGAGAGGGSSWIEQSAVKLILAAGNGGNGGNGGGAGGFGGTEVGGNGGDSSGSGGGNGGIGASIIAGGTGGTGGGGGTDGSDGSSGAGGAGGAAGDGNVRGGGGGGGGLYGGGGGEGGNGSGDGGGGGGGGSSLVPTGGYSFVAVSSVKRDGLVVLSWVE